MALRLFNTLRRQVEEFIPFDVQDKNVGMYCCLQGIHGEPRDEYHRRGGQDYPPNC